LLGATPDRQDAAHRYFGRDVSVAGFRSHANDTAMSIRAGDCGEQRMDALRRRVSQG